MLRFSVSILETFRRILECGEVYDTEERLLEQLKGVYVPSDKARLGTAGHNILEGNYKTVGGYIEAEADGSIIAFTPEQATPILKFRSDHPGIVHEIPTYQEFDTPAMGKILVSMRIDGVEGARVWDFKFTGRIDVNKYVNSVQWKMYLHALGLDAFTYQLFKVSRFQALPLEAKTCIEPVEPLNMIRYDNMEQDLQNIVNEFTEYLVRKGYTHYLRSAEQYIANSGIS